MKKRSKLDERYMKQVHALLTPEQVQALPKLPSQIKREATTTGTYTLNPKLA